MFIQLISIYQLVSFFLGAIILFNVKLAYKTNKPRRTNRKTLKFSYLFVMFTSFQARVGSYQVSWPLTGDPAPVQATSGI